MAMMIEPDLDFNSQLQLLDDISLPCDERYSDSPYVERVWRSYSGGGGSFVSMAESHWEIVIGKYQNTTTLTVRGPETQATPAFGPPNMEFLGIVFKHGAFMPKFPASMLMDRQDVNLPSAGSKTFWLDSSAWEYPTFENVDTFVDRLMRKELLVFDPLINMVLQEQPVDMSQRTLQRRFLRATGLTYNTMFQIQRARYATTLLKHGLSILDTVSQVGYADQPHLTRMLKRYMGQTPAQIVSRTLEKPMSLLFKTAPF